MSIRSQRVQIDSALLLFRLHGFYLRSRCNRYIRTAFVLQVLLVVFAALHQRQAVGQTTIGVQPLGSYIDGGVERINLADLGVNVDIPLFQHQGRGSGLDLNIHLVYDSSYGFSSTPFYDLGWRVVASNSGAGTITPTITESDFVPLPCQTGEKCNAGYTEFQYAFTFTDPSGYVHRFWNADLATSVRCQGVSPQGCTDQNLNVNGSAEDGSGYIMNVNPTTPGPQPNQILVTAPSGELYSWSPDGLTAATDTNGNTASAVYNPADLVNPSQPITDDTNVSATITGGAYNTSNTTEWTSRAPLKVQYYDTTGSLQTVTVNYSMHTVSQNCGSSGFTFSTATGMVDSVDYPDGTSYQFTYQPNGQLASMKLPTGGTVSYNPSSLCTNTATTGGSVGLPASITRTTSDGTTQYSQTATPSAPYGIYPATSATTISKPDGSSETVNFIYVFFPGGRVGLTNNNYNYETAHKWYSASGSLLKSEMKCYNGATGDCTVTSVTLPITQIATTTTIGGLTSKTIQYMTATGLATELDEFDFGASSLSRKTVTSYASLGNNIVDRPSSVTVSDASGNTVSNTTYGYDEYSLTATSGLPGHGTVSGSRGNQTSQHVWLNTAKSTIDSHRQYDDAGQILAVQDPRTNWTYYGYDSTTDSCRTSTTPPTPSSGVSQATSATCDSHTGLPASASDANGVITSYSYDLMLRPTGTVTKTAAGVVAASMTHSYSGSTLPEVIKTTVTASPSPNQVSSVTLDGLGRTVTTVSSSGAEVDTTYNSMGYVQSVSNPYLTKGDSTYGITSYLYDGLGRKLDQCQPENTPLNATTCTPNNSYLQWSYSGNVTTQRDEAGNNWARTTDALGRLTQVVEPGSLTTKYAYDALNNLLTVNQLGTSTDTARTRNFTYDSLSRLLCASNPENSQNACPASATATMPSGITSYGYDPNGNLSSKTDPRGITTNYGYDALNRLQSKTYTNDTTGTASSCYQYDGASTSNSIGRLINQWTQMIPSGACAITLPSTGYLTLRSILAYDSMGRVQSEQQCTRSNCAAVTPTPYKQAYTYDLAGNILTYGNGVGTMTFTNCYDAGGRLLSVVKANTTCPATLSPSTTLFSAAGYNPAGGLTAATFGTGLKLSRTYDSRFRVTGETDIGNAATSTPGSATLTITGTEHVQ